MATELELTQRIETAHGPFLRKVGMRYDGLRVWVTSAPQVFAHWREAYEAVAGGREATVVLQAYVLPDGTPVYDGWTQEGFEKVRAIFGGMECYLCEPNGLPSALVFPITEENDTLLFALRGNP